MAKRKDYSTRLENLRARRYDVALSRAIVSASFSKEARATVKYVYEAMEPIPQSYTDNTYTEARRVQSQIDALPMSFEFDYQGSVPLNTHIRLHSDLDILVVRTMGNLSSGFTAIQLGATIKLLTETRSSIDAKLRAAFPTANVDNAGCKALNISGGSLTRHFDVITCSWYDSYSYQQSKLKKDREIWLNDKCKGHGSFDGTFAHMHAVNMKDARAAGNYKRVIRLLKTLRSDAKPEIKLSSFVITSVMYHLPDAEFSQTDYSVAVARRVSMLVNTRNHLDRVITNTLYRRGLKSPNGSESLFNENDTDQVTELRKLRQELDDILLDLAEEVDSQPFYQKHYGTTAEALQALSNRSIIYG